MEDDLETQEKAIVDLMEAAEHFVRALVRALLQMYVLERRACGYGGCGTEKVEVN